jgi:hypothetical protein
MRTDLQQVRGADRYDDLVVANNDFVMGPSDEQHIQDTIEAAPGWWKQHPQDGVDMQNYLNSSGLEQEIRAKCKVQMKTDNYNLDFSATYSSDGRYTVKIIGL